jgi:hypothetical protein
MIPLFLDKNLSHVYTFSQRDITYSRLCAGLLLAFLFSGALFYLTLLSATHAGQSWWLANVGEQVL